MKSQARVAAIITKDNKILGCKRRLDQTFPNKWYLPGGKLKEGETLHNALYRELKEELGISIILSSFAKPLANITAKFDYGTFDVHFFRVTEWIGEIENKEHADIAWFDTDTLSDDDLYNWIFGDYYVTCLALLEKETIPSE